MQGGTKFSFFLRSSRTFSTWTETSAWQALNATQEPGEAEFMKLYGPSQVHGVWILP